MSDEYVSKEEVEVTPKMVAAVIAILSEEVFWGLPATMSYQRQEALALRVSRAILADLPPRKAK